MSFTNEKLFNAIKQNEFPTFEDLIPHIKEMIDNAEPISESNKQLIVAKYDLKNIGEIFRKLNLNGGNYSNNGSLSNHIVQRKEFSTAELAEEIENTFLNYKKYHLYIYDKTNININININKYNLLFYNL